MISFWVQENLSPVRKKIVYVDKPPRKKKKAKQKENAEHQMAAKEQDYSCGNKKSEYLDQKK